MDPESNKTELWEPLDSVLTKMGGMIILMRSQTNKTMYIIFNKFKFPAIISFILVLPFMILESVTRLGYHEGLQITCIPIPFAIN